VPQKKFGIFALASARAQWMRLGGGGGTGIVCTFSPDEEYLRDDLVSKAFIYLPGQNRARSSFFAGEA
jgi:hypothetical protein